MRIPKKYVSIARTVTILTLLLIATSITSAHSSLQQEVSIQNTADILFSQDNFTETIFFEYGAESGVLQPPWDFSGPNGSEDTSGSEVTIVETPVRTGTKSMRFYQVPPPKSDAQRRVGAKYWSHTQHESYFSFWAYFPTGYDTAIETAGWLTIGGYTLYWNKEAGGYVGLRARFFMYKDADGLYTQMSWSRIEDGATSFWKNGDKSYLTLNQWHHFQIYLKNNASGNITAWVNDVQTAQWIEATDGASHGHQSGDYYWRGDRDTYTLIVETYGADNTPENTMYFDDIVGATQEIPENYGVIEM